MIVPRVEGVTRGRDRAFCSEECKRRAGNARRTGRPPRTPPSHSDPTLRILAGLGYPEKPSPVQDFPFPSAFHDPGLEGM